MKRVMVLERGIETRNDKEEYILNNGLSSRVLFTPPPIEEGHFNIDELTVRVSLESHDNSINNYIKGQFDIR